MTGFLGRYEHQLDEKGRVSLPAPFRREAGEDPLVLLQWESSSLTLFPGPAWQEVKDNLLGFRKSQPEAADSVRWIASNAVEVSPDKQGRILIPSWLQESASLGGTALLIGAINRIEIWDPGRFAALVRDRQDEFRPFAHQIFG